MTTLRCGTGSAGCSGRLISVVELFASAREFLHWEPADRPSCLVLDVQSHGLRARLRRPLDFLVIADHASNLGVAPMIAQGYQESGLDHSRESTTGAVGIMQLLPTTAADPNVGMPDISGVEDNVHAGARYLRFLVDRYFADEPLDVLDEHFFAFAAYNAGPARVARLRAEAAEQGLDPNQWFHNVELIAARRIGRETVQYVSNIYKYYVAYSRIAELERRRPSDEPGRR